MVRQRRRALTAPIQQGISPAAQPLCQYRRPFRGPDLNPSHHPISRDLFSWRGTLALLAASLLGYALQISNGTLHPDAFALATAVLAIGAAAILLRDRALSPQASLVPLLMGLGALSVFFSIHFTSSPGIYLQVGRETFIEHHQYAAVAAILCGVILANGRSRAPLLALLAIYFALGLWLLKASPNPNIDVWYWHRAGYEALAKGIDPYGITMPNIYGHTQWFAPGLADNTKVFVGYPYPPVTMLLGGLGHLVKQDYRYFNLVAQTLAAGLIGFSRPGRMASLAAIIFLFTPRGLFVLEQGWTESISALAVAACACCASRWPRALPWVFGIMLGVKQYFVFALPLLPILLGTKKPAVLLPFLLKAAIIPVAITLPFILWDPGAFLNSVVLFQAKQPFRPDALSLMAWLVAQGGPMLPLNISFLLSAVFAALALWKSDRTPAAFFAALALVLFTFFFFAKQAFTNYYYLVVACFCAACAGGLSGLASSRADTSSPT